MACGSCGSGARKANHEYLITYKHDGSTERVASLAEARVRLGQSPQSGTVQMVPKLAK